MTAVNWLFLPYFVLERMPLDSNINCRYHQIYIFSFIPAWSVFHFDHKHSIISVSLFTIPWYFFSCYKMKQLLFLLLLLLLFVKGSQSYGIWEDDELQIHMLLPQRCFDVHATLLSSEQRCINVKTTSFAFIIAFVFLLLLLTHSAQNTKTEGKHLVLFHFSFRESRVWNVWVRDGAACVSRIIALYYSCFTQKRTDLENAEMYDRLILYEQDFEAYKMMKGQEIARFVN